MKLESAIVKAYIDRKSVDIFSENWYFLKEGYCYQEPSYDKDHIEAVSRIYSQIREIIENFIPCNLNIWEAIFPEWKRIIGEVTINLIVGFPEPNDATVLKAPDGCNHVILDLGLWVKYEGKCNMRSVIHNLLTHELCHICIGETVTGIDEDTKSECYLTNLDANTFHEGFAHLVSFEDKNIDSIDWKEERWNKVKEATGRKMQEALKATDKQEQEKYLYDAVYGNYFDKFACMSGMLYLVECWQKNGIQGLRTVFEEGYAGFSAKVVKPID